MAKRLWQPPVRRIMAISRDKRLERAQMRVLFPVPFFAPGVARLPVVWDDKIDTACTDGREIRWSPAFFDKLKDQELVTVLCHEVCHCMLGHLWRAPGGVDWDTWNQATDHAVDLMLKEFSGLVIAKQLADPFPFPDPQDAYYADPAFAGLSEEVIYELLSKRQPKGDSAPPSGNSAPTNSRQNMPVFGEMRQP